MMKEQYLRPVAVFLACLIISFPFYVSNAMAIQVEPPTIHGNDNVQNYVRPTGDKIFVSVKVSDPKINGSDLTFNSNQFNECHDISELVYKRQCTYQSAGVTRNNNGQISARIRFPVLAPGFDDVDTYIFGDGTPPSISDFQISPSVASSGNLTIIYTATDTCNACGGSGNICAGLGGIKVTDSAGIKTYFTKQIHSSSDNVYCSQETGAIEIPVTSFSAGSNSITISVYDRLNNTATYSSPLTFIYDNAAPVISNIKLTNSTGGEISYVDADGEPAKIMFDVTETYSSITAIKADLTSMNQGIVTIDSTNLQTQCTTDAADATTKHCNITVSPLTAASGDLHHDIVINATDNASNTGTKSATVDYELDNTAPTISRIKSEYLIGDKYYLKQTNNTVYVDVGDSAAGIKNAVLSGGNFNLVEDLNCTSDACSWIINVEQNQVSGATISLTATITDTVNNQNSTTSTFTLDKSGPTLVNVNDKPKVTIVNTNGEFLSNAVAGIAVYAEFNDSESALSKAYANFSRISAMEGWQEGTCQKIGTTAVSECVWPVSTLIPTSAADFKIYFNATDILGNVLETTTPEKGLEIKNFTYNYTDSDGNIVTAQAAPLEILYQETNETNYWKVYIPAEAGNHSPEALDRQIGEIQQHMYFIIKMKPISLSDESIQPISFELDECTGENAQYISSGYPEMIEGIDKKGPHYLDFLLDAGVLPPGDLDNITCFFTITSKIKTATGIWNITKPEKANVTLTIPLYSMPLGEISDVYSKEIMSVANSWLIRGEWLETAEKIITFAETICRMIGVVVKIQRILAIYNSGLGFVCASSMATGATFSKKVCDEQIKTGNKNGELDEKIRKLTNTNIALCKAVSCQLFWGKAGFIEESKTNWAEEYLGDWATFAESQGALGKLGGRGTEGEWYSTWSNPQNSIITSLAFLCLPGIIHNLHKAAAIDCSYILCLADKASSGMPPQQCVAMRSMAYCQFVWGQFYAIIPFVHLIDSLLKNIYKLLTNYVSLMEFGVKFICKVTCVTPGNTMCIVCVGVEYLKFAKDLACDLGWDITGFGSCSAVWEGITTFGDEGVCSQAKKAAEDIKSAYDKRHEEAETSNEPELQNMG